MDLHPNHYYHTVTEAIAGTEVIEEVPLAQVPTPLAGSKLLVIELLRCFMSATMASAALAGARTTGRLTDADDNVLAELTIETSLTTSGAYAICGPTVFDFTDGQGNGILLAHNPNLSVVSSSMGAVQACSAVVLWRYKAVDPTELISMS